MSKEKKNSPQSVSEFAQASPAPSRAMPPAFTVASSEKLSEVDKLTLDLAKTKRQTALAEAKTALANNENAELTFKYLVLQLYMKYSLTSDDAISETGDIVRGGAIGSQTQGQ